MAKISVKGISAGQGATDEDGMPRGRSFGQRRRRLSQAIPEPPEPEREPEPEPTPLYDALPPEKRAAVDRLVLAYREMNAAMAQKEPV